MDNLKHDSMWPPPIKIAIQAHNRGLNERKVLAKVKEHMNKSSILLAKARALQMLSEGLKGDGGSSEKRTARPASLARREPTEGKGNQRYTRSLNTLSTKRGSDE